MDLQAATLPELEAESAKLSVAIRDLARQRESVDDEISQRHAAIAVVRAASTATPAQIDDLLRGKPQEAPRGQ